MYQRFIHDPLDSQRYAYDSAERLAAYSRAWFGEGDYAPSSPEILRRADRSAQAEQMLARKQATSRIHERARRNRPLTGKQRESNRQKSRIRARIEHIFGYMSQLMKGSCLRYIGRRRNTGAIGLINLTRNLPHCEQIVRLKLLPLPAA